METPIGTLRLVADDIGLREIRFAEPKQVRDTPALWIRARHPFTAARQQLEEYFAGARKAFDLPLHPVGTPFQLSVWQELARIPYGVTNSYGDIARRIDRPKAVRAVGAANGRNPLPIVVPCHRVIGGNGSLTGFAGGLPTTWCFWNVGRMRDEKFVQCLVLPERVVGRVCRETVPPRQLPEAIGLGIGAGRAGFEEVGVIVVVVARDGFAFAGLADLSCWRERSIACCAASDLSI
ncbi:MAG: hypothetical protein WDW36_007030 [Sanguina aurantia]